MALSTRDEGTQLRINKNSSTTDSYTTNKTGLLSGEIGKMLFSCCTFSSVSDQNKSQKERVEKQEQKGGKKVTKEHGRKEQCLQRRKDDQIVTDYIIWT